MTAGTNTTKQQLRDFGQVTGLAVVVIFGLFLPWLFEHDYPRWPWALALILWLFAFVYPLALKPVSKVWMKIGYWLGWFNTRLILGLMYYTVFFIVGIVMKLIGKDPMARKLDSSAKSYRVKSQVRSRDHVERPF